MLTNYYPIPYLQMVHIPTQRTPVLIPSLIEDCNSQEFEQLEVTPDEHPKFLNEEYAIQSDSLILDRLDHPLDSSKYVIIRHANSTFNYTMSQLPENGVRIDGEVHFKELDAISDINLLDAELSELGI